VAAVTALAGEMLGLKLIYLDAGSGAKRAVQPRMVAAVRKETTVPLIVGGGIRSTSDAYDAWSAGADILVVGNAAEKDPDFILEMAAANKEINAVHGQS
jgi:putative glycerol-1-phosphate prenyltransferase